MAGYFLTEDPTTWPDVVGLAVVLLFFGFCCWVLFR